VKKRLNKKIHTKYLDDIVMDISLSNKWRNEIFNLEKGQHLNINKESKIPIPTYIERPIFQYNLQYIVCVVESCPEYFDEGLIIFQFSPKNFPNVKRYSGNNPDVR